MCLSFHDGFIFLLFFCKVLQSWLYLILSSCFIFQGLCHLYIFLPWIFIWQKNLYFTPPQILVICLVIFSIWFMVPSGTCVLVEVSFSGNILLLVFLCLWLLSKTDFLRFSVYCSSLNVTVLQITCCWWQAGVGRDSHHGWWWGEACEFS